MIKTFRKISVFVFIAIIAVAMGCSNTSDWEKATRAYEAGKYKKAIKYFTRVRENVPTRENSADYMIGDSYFKLGEYEKAKEAFKRIIEPQQTDNLVKLYSKALWEFNGGFPKKALPYFEMIVQTNPTFQEGTAYFYYLRTVKKVQGLEKALEKTRLALTIFPGNIKEKGILNLYNLYGSFLMEAERWTEAEEFLKKALPLEDDFLIRYNLGIVYENMGRIEDARSQFFQSFTLGGMEEAKWKFFKYLSLEEIGENLDLFNFTKEGYDTFLKAVNIFEKNRFELFRYWVQKALEKDFNVEKMLYQWGDRELRNEKDPLRRANLLHYVKGSGKAAAEAYENVKKNEVERDLNLAILQVKAGDFQSADTLFSAISGDLTPIQRSRMLFYRGLSDFNTEKIEDAVKKWKDAQDLNDKIMTLGYFQGLLSDMMKEDLKGRDMIIDMILKNSNDREIREWIGQSSKR